MKIKVFTNSLFFYCFLWPFKCQNRFPWSVLCKYWWHNFKTSILLWKINFTSDFSAGSRKWRQNYDLSIFQVLRTGAFLWPEINIVGRYMGCFDLIFVSERSGWSGRRTWKMDKMYSKNGIMLLCGITVTCFRCHPKRWSMGVQGWTQGENHWLGSTAMTKLWKRREKLIETEKLKTEKVAF